LKKILYIFAAFVLGIVTRADEPLLSVGVLESRKSVYISAQHGFQLYQTKPVRKKLFTRWNSKSLRFEVTDRGMGFLNVKHQTDLHIKPFKNGYVYVNGKGYRGSVRLFEDSFGKITVVNLVKLEKYLYGVIKSEMLINSPVEALKSQAVVARTYAIKNQHKFLKEKGFGLTDDVRSQVYNGIEDEHQIARDVVNATRGKILTYKDEPISAYYHSACGGSTSDSRDWYGKEIEFLRAKTCTDCSAYRNYNWKLDIDYSEITYKLRVKGHRLGGIHDIEFERTEEGRVRKVILKDSTGDLKMTGAAFRTLLGPSRLRSTIFKVVNPLKSKPKNQDKAELAILSIIHGSRKKDKSLFLEGSGFGHGVGLCQWGAKGLAKQGFNYQDILRYYYTGVTVASLY